MTRFPFFGGGRPTAPAFLVGLGFLVLAALPWLGAAPAAGQGALGSALASLLGVVLVSKGWPRPAAQHWSRVPHLRSLVCDVGEGRADSPRRFVLLGQLQDGTELVVRQCSDPAELTEHIRSALVPVEYRWSTGNLHGARPPEAFELRAYPWPGRERIRGIQLLLVAVLGAAWIIVLSGSTSPVFGLSLFLSLGSWLFMAAVAAVLIFDEIRIEASESWIVERRRMGLFRRVVEFDWREIAQLQCVGPAHGQHYLLLSGTTKKGQNGSWSWPLEPSAAEELNAHLGRSLRTHAER